MPGVHAHNGHHGFGGSECGERLLFGRAGGSEEQSELVNQPQREGRCLFLIVRQFAQARFDLVHLWPE